MRWIETVCGALTLLLLLSGGCKRANVGGVSGDTAAKTHASIVKAAIESIQKATASLNQVNDANSATKATTVLQNETSNLQRLKQDLAALGSASSAEKQRVKQHSQDMIKESQAVQQAVANVVRMIQQGQFPKDVATNLANAGSAFGQAMADFGQQATPLFD
ncbi:MAG TPA: hypothetical protein VKS79_18240 [Gemmataceae bacterium]|nr:hypothetical protein [Gemmataceae bacterium]